MAKVNSLFMRKANGKLAGATLYTEAGVTIMREINQSPKNPRTHAQMAHRVKLANLVNMYRALRPWLLLSTENKEALKSDYNMFVSRNLAKSKVYLPKDLANRGFFNADAYVITAGSLAVNTNLTGWTQEVSGESIKIADVASGTTLTSSTTFGTFSKLFTEGANAGKGWQDGMQVSIIVVSGGFVNGELESPGAVGAFSFVLNVNSTATAASVLGSAFTALSISGTSLVLDTSKVCNGLGSGIVMIASKTIGGKTFVNNSTMLVSQYGPHGFYGEDALQPAIESYGSTTDPYLTTPTPEPLG